MDLGTDMLTLLPSKYLKPMHSSVSKVKQMLLLHVAVCVKGTGTQPSTSACQLCPRGTFNNGETTNPYTSQEREFSECLQCPLLEFQYPGHASGITKEVPGTTRVIGSETDSNCVPRWLQPVSATVLLVV